MPYFLITHEITVARQVPPESREPPPAIRLKLHSVMDAASEEDVHNRSVRHSYPGFVSRISSVVPLDDATPTALLAALMDASQVLVEDKI